MDINIGIKPEERKAIASGLSQVLADSYTLYLKTHNYHWNVSGPQFNTLHQMFEGQYNELAIAVDDIAERIRALGFDAPGSYRAYSELTEIEEEDDVPVADEMIRQLVIGQETVARNSRKVIELAENAGDHPSADLLTQRVQLHEKNAWMLRSMLNS